MLEKLNKKRRLKGELGTGKIWEPREEKVTAGNKQKARKES